MKMPEVIKRAQAAVGTDEYPHRHAEAREYVEEIHGALDDSLREDVRIRAERTPAPAEAPPG